MALSLKEWVGGGFLLLQIGLVAWLFLRLRRQARTFPCPVCGKAISWNRLGLSGVACPHCPWEVQAHPRPEEVRAEPVIPRVVETEGECPCCGCALAGQVAVRLWDGRKYRRECVELACPGLADYAERHDCLEETMPYSAWGVAARTAVLVTLGIGTSFGLPLIAVVLFAPGNRLAAVPLPALFTCVGVIFLPVLLLWVTGAGVAFAYGRSTVLVRGGRVIVQLGNAAAQDYPLSDCAWFPGTTWQDSPYILPRRPALLLVLPEQPGAPSPGYQAVGFTEPTRRAWAAFLTLAGVPCCLPGGRPRTWLHDLRDGLLILFLFPVGMGIGALLGLVVGLAIGLLTGDIDLAGVLGGLTFLCGALTLIFYTPLLWTWITGDRGETPIVSRRREKSSPSGWRMFAAITLSVLVLGLPLLLWDKVRWRARLMGFLFLVVWSWLFFKGEESLAAALDKRAKNDPMIPDDTRDSEKEGDAPIA